MRLSSEEKDAKRWMRYRSQLLKIAKGAEISHADGWVCLTYSNGQVFRCRGALAYDTFGQGE